MQSNGCEKYRELLFDYASDMLDDAESKELEMHINSCPECSGELTEIKAMLAAAAQIEEEKPSSELKNRISASLAEESRRIMQRRRIIFGRTAAAAVSFAACAALAVGIYSGGIYDKFVKNDDSVLTDSVKTSGNADINASGDKNNAPSDTDANTDVVKEERQEGQTDTSAGVNTPKNQSDNNSLSSSSNSERVSPSKSGGNTESKESNESNESNASAAESKNDTENTKRDAEADKIKDSSSENGANYAAPQSEDEQTEKRAADSAYASASGGASLNRRSADYTSDVYAMDGADNGASASVSAAKAASEPVSCTVVCDNPTEFAKRFGVSESGDTISFDISLDMWQSIVGYAADCGAELSAEYGENLKGIISVTVTAD